MMATAEPRGWTPEHTATGARDRASAKAAAMTLCGWCFGARKLWTTTDLEGELIPVVCEGCNGRGQVLR